MRTPTKIPPSIIMLFVRPDLIGNDFITAPPAFLFCNERTNINIVFAEKNADKLMLSSNLVAIRLATDCVY
jgi:hypothetical protein